jgi:hypothetical protein
VEVETVPAGWPLALLDVGSGGFLVSASHPFPLDEVFDFWFHSPDGAWATALTARVIYTHERTLPGERPPEFVAGFAFVSTHLPLTQQRVRDLVRAAQPSGHMQ